MTQWWFITLNQELGPLCITDLADLVRRGVLTKTDRVRKGDGLWQTAHSVGELAQLWSADETLIVETNSGCEATLDCKPDQRAAKMEMETARHPERNSASSTAADALQRMLIAATQSGVHRTQSRNLRSAEVQFDDSPRAPDNGPPIDFDSLLIELHEQEFPLRAPSHVNIDAPRKYGPRQYRLSWIEIAIASCVCILILQMFPQVAYDIFASMDVRTWSWRAYAAWNALIVALLMVNNGLNR